MPVYEYECGSCKKVFEVQQRMADEPLSQCPECGGEVRKIISQSSFQLKGGGWYNDGYSGPSNGGASASKSAAPSCSSGGCCNCPAAT